MRLGKEEGDEFIPAIKNMETILTIFAFLIFIAVELWHKYKMNKFVNAQMRLNRNNHDTWKQQILVNDNVNIALGNLNSRLKEAGTKIIELNEAIVLPTDGEIN